MLMWRREEIIEMRACFHASTKLDTEAYVLVGPSSKCCEEE
jgi:hypothetical protein